MSVLNEIMKLILCIQGGVGIVKRRVQFWLGLAVVVVVVSLEILTLLLRCSFRLISFG